MGKGTLNILGVLGGADQCRGTLNIEDTDWGGDNQCGGGRGMLNIEDTSWGLISMVAVWLQGEGHVKY